MVYDYDVMTAGKRVANICDDKLIFWQCKFGYKVWRRDGKVATMTTECEAVSQENMLQNVPSFSVILTFYSERQVGEFRS